MVAASWGDSDSDADHEEIKTRCLMADDDEVNISHDKAFLKSIIFDLKKIVDNQVETIKDNDSIIEIQRETMKKVIECMNDYREEIDNLSAQLTEQRELTKASVAKAEFLETELNTLCSDDEIGQDDCVCTLKKIIEDLHLEIVNAKQKITALTMHESVMKELWEKERLSEQVAQHKEQFKRFVPQRRGLGYVEQGSEECKQSSTNETCDSKATCSEGIQITYID